MYIREFQNYSNPEYVNCIELIGMPASGKSTKMMRMLENQSGIVDVNGQLPNSNIKRQIYKLWCIVAVMLFSPRMFIHDSLVILSSSQKSIKDIFSVISNWFLIMYLYKKK